MQRALSKFVFVCLVAVCDGAHDIRSAAYYTYDVAAVSAFVVCPYRAGKSSLQSARAKSSQAARQRLDRRESSTTTTTTTTVAWR